MKPWAIFGSWLAGMVLLGAFLFFRPTNSSEMASWVQAIGSIAAIIGAAWIASRQAAAHAESQRRKDIAISDAVLYLFANAGSAIQQAIERLEQGEQVTPAHFDGICERVSRFPIEQLPNLMLTEYLHHLYFALDNCRLAVGKEPADLSMLRFFKAGLETLTSEYIRKTGRSPFASS